MVLFIKGRIHEINILFVHFSPGQFQALAKALEVYDLPLAQEFDDIVHIRVVRETQDIVVGLPGLLLCCDLVRTTFLLSELGRLSGRRILCYNNPEFGCLSILNGDL